MVLSIALQEIKDFFFVYCFCNGISLRTDTKIIFFLFFARIFSRRIIRSGLQKTQLVVVELLRGGQRDRGSPQAVG